MRKSITMLAGLMLVVVMSSSLVGCSSGPDEITAADVRSDMSPALDSTARHREQDWNRYARSIDHTTRQAWDDLATILLIDRPVRLTEYPIP